MALSVKDKETIKNDALKDVEAGTTRVYKGDALVDTVFAPIDALTGTPSTRERAEEKTEYYDEVRKTLVRNG